MQDAFCLLPIVRRNLAQYDDVMTAFSAAINWRDFVYDARECRTQVEHMTYGCLYVKFV